MGQIQITLWVSRLSGSVMLTRLQHQDSLLHCQIHHILAKRMTLVHGSLAAFDSSKEEWTEHLEFYFATNDITNEENNVQYFLKCCGPSTFCLMRSVVLPTHLTDFSFKELVAKMKAHLHVEPSTLLPIQLC